MTYNGFVARRRRQPQTILGPTIRRLREERHLQVNELANAVGVDASYMGRIERGDVSNLSSDLLASLALALNVSIDYLYIEAGVLTGKYAPGKLNIAERRLIEAIRNVPVAAMRQRLTEVFTYVAEVAQPADELQARRLGLAAESKEPYGEGD